MTCLTYSILKRIVASATMSSCLLTGVLFNLQYPQTDRRLCNIVGIDNNKPIIEFYSILKRIVASATTFYYVKIILIRAYSILKRIVASATAGTVVCAPL